MFSNLFMRCCLALGCGLVLWGCSPSGTGAMDEEKEPLFLIGRSRVTARDYQGAIEAFEQALETNPRSAAAHFELGILYAEKDSAPAAAIYHYEKFLRLRPNAGNAEIVREQIIRLKQELAKGVLSIPPSIEIQRQLEQMAEENRRLRDELDRLRATTAQVQPANRTPSSPLLTAGGAGTTSRRVDSAIRPARTTVATRTHQVQAGETLMAIARRYHVKLESLQSVNPGLNPRKLSIGQRLVIPGG
jgi:LysM repeat protein